MSYSTGCTGRTGPRVRHNRHVQPTRTFLVARLHVDLMRVASAVRSARSA